MKTECPNCGQIAQVKEWHDDYWLVEKDFKCECGYHYNWSYGNETIEGDNNV